MNVVIATPGFAMHAPYVASLVATVNALFGRGDSCTWVNGASSLVGHAREMAASGGVRLDADDTMPLAGKAYDAMLWIDSDISWQIGDALRLLDSPYEVTTGVYRLADASTTSVHAWGSAGQSIPVDEIAAMTGPVRVQSCGFGFVAVRTGVFERMDRPWFAHLSQPVMRSNGSAIMDSIGEDISWCVRAHQAGVEIWLDPAVRVTHHKTLPIGWPNG